MNARILGTLLVKDLTLYFRNRFFAFITIAGLALYALIYALMPSTVDEALTVGVYAPTVSDVVLGFLSQNEISITAFESDEALREAVIHAEYPAGIVLPDDIISSVLLGQETEITVYLASDAPPEVAEAMHSVLRLAFNELSYALRGNPLSLELNEVTVGPDMTGQQLALRDRLLPLLAVMMLVLEIMGLGSLITDEVESGTLQALLITPVNVPGLFTAKAIFGVSLAFIQASLLMALTGSLRTEPVIILATLLLGGLVVTGLAFLVASVSRNMMGVMAWGVFSVVVLMLPSYGVVFPGMVTSWSKLIPSYYLFDTIHQVVNLSASWNSVYGNLLILLVLGVVLMAAGVAVMERKVR
jgi:hypothetical protein